MIRSDIEEISNMFDIDEEIGYQPDDYDYGG